MGIDITDRVDYHSIIGGPITSGPHTVKSIELEPNHYGTDVAWVTGKSGCVALDALSLNQEYLYELEEDATCEHGFLVGCGICETLTPL